jgi:hypothetical protein
MKMLNGNSLKAVIGTIAFAVVLLASSQRSAAQVLSPQVTDKDIVVSEFNAINVSDDFEVTVARGAYGARLTVDKDLAPYVEVYVRSRTLFITFDEKAVPRDLRKLYRGRGGLTATFRVVVYTPDLQGVTLSDYAILTGTEEFVASDFELVAAGKSQVKNLSITAASAKVSLKKNATANLVIRADRGLEVSTDNNSVLDLSYDAETLTLLSGGSSIVTADGPCVTMNLTTAGSSQVKISSETEVVDITAEGNSQITLNGKAYDLIIKGSRNASVDALAMPLETVDANMANSSSVLVDASKSIHANLVGGSALYFTGNPAIEIEKIIKSTLAPYGSK